MKTSKQIESTLGQFSGLTALYDWRISRSMTKDDIYQKPDAPLPPFRFNHQVVRVFDDMIRRSVPLYDEILWRQTQMVVRHFQPGMCIYDLGCSTGNLGLGILASLAGQDFKMMAVDSSAPMLEAYEKRLKRLVNADQVQLVCQDLRNIEVREASIVIVNFTLQFLPPEDRQAVLDGIYQGLNPNGLLLFSEKIGHSDTNIAALQQDFHFAFKRENGYSDLEISRKREALEQVLVPDPLEDHLERLKRCRFRTIEVWLKWFNFAAILALK